MILALGGLDGIHLEVGIFLDFIDAAEDSAAKVAGDVEIGDKAAEGGGLVLLAFFLVLCFADTVVGIEAAAGFVVGCMSLLGDGMVYAMPLREPIPYCLLRNLCYFH